LYGRYDAQIRFLNTLRLTFLTASTYTFGVLNFQNEIPVSYSPLDQSEDNSVLRGILSDLLSNGCITSISEEQKRVLQGLSSKLQQENQEREQQPGNKVKRSSQSELPRRNTTT
jgi:hypothetical protein